jgi:hypothetical protein
MKKLLTLCFVLGILNAYSQNVLPIIGVGKMYHNASSTFEKVTTEDDYYFKIDKQKEIFFIKAERLYRYEIKNVETTSDGDKIWTVTEGGYKAILETIFKPNRKLDIDSKGTITILYEDHPEIDGIVYVF